MGNAGDMRNLSIRPFQEQDRYQVVELWKRCGLTRAWSDLNKDIDRKLTTQKEYFYVVELSGKIIGSVIAGYDGHRGDVYYLSVDPNCQGKGIGRLLMQKVEEEFKNIGCPKINLMVRNTNIDVQNFHKEIGYDVQEVMVLGKRLIDD